MPIKEEHTEMNPDNICRNPSVYKNLSNKFKPPQNNYTKQYFHIYLTRISNLRDRLMSRIEQKWGNQYPVCRLGEISEYDGKCIVTGTLFKDQQLKPSLLKDLCEENQLMPQPNRTHFTDDSDVLILEDELQRIQLYNVLNVHDVVTGVPCAILGTDMELGKFAVEDYVFIDCGVQIERPLFDDDRFVVFVSGLDLTNKLASLMSVQLLVDWITGLIGDIDSQTEIKKISRVILAGNSVRSSTDVTNKKSLISRNIETEDTFEAVKLLDELIAQLASSVYVDLMPGEFDPANYMLPQQPLHYCMFPTSNKLSTFNGVPNPYECEIDGIKILGSAGQPVNEIQRYSRIETALEALERTVQWGHLCPTAPDTLACFPFYDKDPFIIQECPHVVFAGNQTEYATKIYKGSNAQEIRLICIPEFIKTQTVVVLNLKNLDTHTVTFRLGPEVSKS